MTPTKLPVRTLLGVLAVALLLVVGGAGGAAADRLITGKQIKDGTITSADVKDKTLKPSDLSAAAMNTLRGKPGPAGAPGPAGTTDVTVRSAEISAQTGEVQVFCAADELALNGSYNLFGEDGGKPVVLWSRPLTATTGSFESGDKLTKGSGWYVQLANAGSTGTVGGTAYVFCGKA